MAGTGAGGPPQRVLSVIGIIGIMSVIRNDVMLHDVI